MNGFPEELLESLIDDLDVAVFFTDVDGIVHYLNEPAAYIVRLPGITAVGRPLDRLLPPEIATYLAAEGREALAGGITRRLHRKSLILPGRGLLFFDIRVAPYRTADDGSWIAYLLLDISARERRKIASDRARENAEAESRARRSFLARMSHEIRTPMNGIMGMTDLALNAGTRDEVDEYLGVIKSASDSLLGIINNILDYSKMESGRLEPERIPLQPAVLLEEVTTLLRPTAEEKGIELTATRGDSLPDAVIGDPLRLRQIIMNLAGNALKFTEKGSVSINLDMQPGKGADEKKGLLLGTVRDTGIGIPKEKLDGLFEPFAQKDAAISREFGGTGLGLAISRNLARLMGGDVDVRSTEGEGSEFGFRILVDLDTGTVEAGSGSTPETGSRRTGDVSEPKWRGERVILAEDNRVNRIIAEKLLRRVGLEPISCNNGIEAMEAWLASDAQLILMDLQMPEMDGVEASRRIRSMEESEGSPPIPIIALTAHVLEEERRNAENAGMNGWVAKPMIPAELFAELARLLPPMVFPGNGVDAE